MFKQIKAMLIGLISLVMLFATEMALAIPADFTDLTDAVDFSTAIAAVLAIFAALAGFAIVWKGGKKILAALGWR